MNESILDEGAVSQIEARANAATKGPWNQSALAGMYIVADGVDFVTVASVGEYNADGSIHLAFDKAVENLEFIKHTREDIPALCATVKHLRAQLKLSEDWRGTALRERGETERLLDAVRKRADTNHAALNDLQSQLEQLREELAEHQRVLRMAQRWEKAMQKENEQLRAENERLKTQRDEAPTGDFDMSKEQQEHLRQITQRLSEDQALIPTRDEADFLLSLLGNTASSSIPTSGGDGR